jgi:hypothetical protein
MSGLPTILAQYQSWTVLREAVVRISKFVPRQASYSDTLVASMLNQDSVPCQCRDHEPATLDRPVLFLPLILIMFASFGFLLSMADLPYGIQLGSLIPYTALIVLGTFSAQRGQQPYFFECSIVRQTMPRLTWRHGGFLLAIVVIETTVLQLTPYMPASWLIAGKKGGSPFAITLFVLCMCLAFAQILTNRSLLARAHQTKPTLA